MMISPANFPISFEYNTRVDVHHNDFMIENTSDDEATIDTWLEDFVSEFRDDIRDKIRIGIGEEGHGRHQ